MKEIKIDGSEIATENDVHKLLFKELDFPEYYGFNLNALWDVLTTDIERPFSIEWINTSDAKRKLGDKYNSIISLLKKVEQYDLKMNFREKFTLIIRD